VRTAIQHGLLALSFALIASLSAKTAWPGPLQLAAVVAAVVVASAATVIVSRLRRRLRMWSHWLLGGVLALAPLGGWVAVRRSFGADPAMLAVALVFWVAGFDIIASCQYARSDREAGIFTLPARWGAKRALIVSSGSHVAACWSLAIFAQLCDLGWIFLLGVIAIVPGLHVAHRLVRPEDLSRARAAGYPAAIVLGGVLLAFAAADVYWRARVWPI